MTQAEEPVAAPDPEQRPASVRHGVRFGGRHRTATFLDRTDEVVDVVSETRAVDALDRLHGDLEVGCTVSDYQTPEMDWLEFLSAEHGRTTVTGRRADATGSNGRWFTTVTALEGGDGSNCGFVPQVR